MQKELFEEHGTVEVVIHVKLRKICKISRAVKLSTDSKDVTSVGPIRILSPK